MSGDLNAEMSERLRGLYMSDDCAKRFFDWAATFTNAKGHTKIEQLENLGMERGEAVNLAKKLQVMGCGRFVIGRRQSPSRMEWRFSLRSLGVAAQGQADQLEPINGVEVGCISDGANSGTASPEYEETLITKHIFRLRPNLGVEILLPQNFSKKEAERLAAFIETLPYND